jgi:hypothetical protein
MCVAWPSVHTQQMCIYIDIYIKKICKYIHMYICICLANSMPDRHFIYPKLLNGHMYRVHVPLHILPQNMYRAAMRRTYNIVIWHIERVFKKSMVKHMPYTYTNRMDSMCMYADRSRKIQIIFLSTYMHGACCTYYIHDVRIIHHICTTYIQRAYISF